jgi:peptide/nickel transport system substrate-binding protein
MSAPTRVPPQEPSSPLRRPMSRRNILQLLAAGGVAVAAAPVLAACGGGSGAPSAGGAAAAVNPAGTLKMTYHLATNSMDPLRMTTGQFISYMWPMYDTLTYVDLKGVVQPSLATKWEYAPDGSALTFTLRTDVKFHDGTAFDANAVKVNIERLLNIDSSPYKGDVANVTAVEVQDPSTVVLRLSAPDAALPALLGRAAGVMVSPQAIATGVDLNTQDAGSGPYKLVEAKLGSHAYYERFDGYWDPSQAGVQRLEIDAISDGQARLNGMRSGTYALAYLTPTQVEPAKAAGFDVAEVESLWNITIFTNWSRPALADPRVRSAIAYAFDRKAIAQSIYFGHATPASGVFPSWFWGSSPNIPNDYFGYDPAKSKQLLAEAGASNVSFEMIFPAGSDPYPQFATLLQQQLKDVGITMNPRPVDINQLATEYSQGRTDALLGGGGQVPDPSVLFKVGYTDKSFFNPAKTVPPELATAVTEAARTVEQSQREASVHKAVDIIAQQALNVPLVYPNVLFAYQPDKVPTYTPSAVGAYAPTRGVAVT